MPHRTRSRRGHGERGSVLILFALILTALATFAAMVMGTSIGYAADRNAQSSADAAAVAATARLRQVRTGHATASQVSATAINVALDNGATAGSVVCEVVNAHYAIGRSESDVIGPCNGTNETSALAAGIRVTVADRRSVPFGSFVGSNEISGVARAAATAQPIRSGSSPFMVCASPSAVGHPAAALIPDAGASPPYKFNPAAIGLSYVLWGAEMKNLGRDCGNGSSSWRGLVNFDKDFVIPSADATNDSDWWEIETGNKSGQISSILAGSNSCATTSGTVETLSVGCRIAVPLCTKGNGSTGSGFKLYCVSMATYQISYIGKVSSGTAPCHATQKNSIICGTLLGGAIANGGPTGASTPAKHDVVVIDLVE